MFKDSFFNFMSRTGPNKNEEDNKMENSVKPIPSDNAIHQISRKESSHQSLDSLIHAQRVSKLGKWEYDIVNDQNYWSDEASRIFGLEKPERFFMSYEKFLNFIHPHDRQNFLSHVRKTIEDGIPHDIEFRIIKLDGTEALVRGQGEALFDNHKKPVRMIGTIEDITQQIEMWKTMEENEQQYKALFYQNPDGVVSFDLQGNFIDINPSLMKMLGYTSEEFPSQFMPLISNEHIMETVEFFKKAADGEQQDYHTVAMHKNGHPIELSVTNVPIIIDNQIKGVYAIGKDITERRRTELALREAEEKYKNLVEDSSVGVYIAQDGVFVYSNPSFNKILGYETLVGKPALELIISEERSFIKNKLSALTLEKSSTHYECRVVKCDNNIVALEVHTSLTIYKGKPAITGTVVDITEKKQAQDLNKYLAYHDPLTTLPNRKFFDSTLDQKIAASFDNNRNFAVMYLDLNRFKYLNETMGPTFGDYLLIKIAERLKDNVEEKGFIARVGGDKFALLLYNSQNVESTVEFAQRITGDIERPFLIEDYELYVTASVGISIYPIDGTDSETLQINTEIALHQAKEYGKNKCQVYTPSMNIESFKMFRLENDLRKALESEELFLEYQPRCDGKTGSILGVEALVRWEHRDWGKVSPAEFIPMAEVTGLIVPIGEWILRTACKQNKEWQLAGIRSICVSVNFSALQLMQKNIVKTVMDVLKETGLEPECLEIEITETSIMDNEEYIINTLRRLQEIGVKIAIDDFGTGYSSLSYLTNFPVNVIKMDKSFVRDIHVNAKTTNIVKSIINLTHSLDMKVVAEGVEKEEQLLYLNQHACDEIQGYLFSKPLPVGQLTPLLRKGKCSSLSFGAKNIAIENRRKFFRVSLLTPLAADMTIVEIKGKKIDIGKTEVLIEDVGPGGVRFIANIKLAVQPEIILQFQTEILNHQLIFYGHIVRQNDLEDNLFEYGLEFIVNKNDREKLTRILNEFERETRKSPVVPGCRLIKTSTKAYFKAQL